MTAKDFIHDVIYDNPVSISSVFLISFAAIALSTILIITIGFPSISILLLIPFVYYSIRNRLFLVLVLIVCAPIVATILHAGLNIVSYGIVSLVIFLWTARLIFSRSPLIEFPGSLSIYIALFMFMLIISMLLNGINKEGALSLIRFTLFFAFVLSLYNILDKRDILKILVAMTIPLFISTYFIISTYSHAFSLATFIGLLRNKVTGFLSNANTFGLILMAAIPFWISIMLWWDRKHMRVIAGIVSIILSVGILLTNSRAAIVGYAVSLFAFSIWKKKAKYFIAVLLLAGILIALTPQAETIISLAFRVDRGSSSRIDIWQNTINIIKSNIAIGIGVGNFGTTYDSYYPLGYDRWFFGRMPHAHNFVLTKTAELGIPGFFLAIFLYLIPLRACLRIRRELKESNDKAIVYGFLATFIAFFTHSFFEGGGMLQEGRLYPDILFWIWLVLLLKIDAEISKSNKLALEQEHMVT